MREWHNVIEEAIQTIKNNDFSDKHDKLLVELLKIKYLRLYALEEGFLDLKRNIEANIPLIVKE
jgi:hypothetical protein